MGRILVVDDESRIVDVIARSLSSLGIATDGVSDPQEALDLLLREEYDLVLLDLMMPRLDGATLMRRTLAARPGTQFLMVSARSDVAAKVRCLEIGAVDYLTKPFALAELVARVRARLRERAVERGTLRRVGGLTLDVERREADVGEGAVALSTREFLLLQRLVDRGGADVTREELLAEAWGCSFDPGTNVVDVCVRRLRAKLGADVIETVRNVGYRLQAP